MAHVMTYMVSMSSDASLVTLSDFDQSYLRRGTMASPEIAPVCGLKVRVDCQDRLCVNSDADETLA